MIEIVELFIQGRVSFCIRITYFFLPSNPEEKSYGKQTIKQINREGDHPKIRKGFPITNPEGTLILDLKFLEL